MNAISSRIQKADYTISTHVVVVNWSSQITSLKANKRAAKLKLLKKYFSEKKKKEKVSFVKYANRN